MNNPGAWLAIALLAAGPTASAPVRAADSTHAGHAGMGDRATAAERAKTWQGMLTRAPLAATGAFDTHGRLWLATVKDGHVWLGRSDDHGESFSTPTMVNPAPEQIAADGENRPQIIVTATDRVYVSWVQALEQPFSGAVRFAASRDGGQTFSAPVTVNDNRDPISHRFQAMAADSHGDIHLVWLDKRDQRAAEVKGWKYAGAAVYHAVSGNNGVSFSANEKIADHSCECCRIALTPDTDGTPVVFWRHVFGDNIRDHALQRLDGKSALIRVSHDDWAVDACPHHGPALAIGRDGVYHLAWFTGAPGRAGLYYARSTDQGKHFSAPMRFGDGAAQAAHPQVLSLGQDVWLAWKEFDGREALVRVMNSSDSGRSWSAPRSLATACTASDHPLLITDGARVYVSWFAAREGYRLIDAGGTKP
jgi:hypothetical protein